MHPFVHFFFFFIDHAYDLIMLVFLVLIFIVLIFGADLPHLGGRPSVCWRHAAGVCVGGGARFMVWHPNDMMLRDMIRHVIGIVDIVDIVWPTELDDYWPVHAWPPASPHTDPTLRSAEAPLSSLRKGPHRGKLASCHAPVQNLHWHLNSIKLPGWGYCA